MKTEDVLKIAKDKELWKYFLGFGTVLILFLAFTEFVTSALLLAAAVVTAIIVNAFGLRNFGIELTTLATVLFGMAFGPTTGGMIGLILILLQLVLGQYINTYILWVVPGYVLAGVVAGMVTGGGVASVGIMITIALNVFFILCTAAFTPPQLLKYLPYAGLNVLINFILFTTIAPQIFNLMA